MGAVAEDTGLREATPAGAGRLLRYRADPGEPRSRAPHEGPSSQDGPHHTACSSWDPPWELSLRNGPPLSPQQVALSGSPARTGALSAAVSPVPVGGDGLCRPASNSNIFFLHTSFLDAQVVSSMADLELGPLSSVPVAHSLGLADICGKKGPAWCGPRGEGVADPHTVTGRRC